MALWVVLGSTGCAFARPPETPDPALLGCYRLSPDLTGVYGDSLTYRVPDVIQLAYWISDQWVVLPTGFEYHPSWTIFGGLPEDYYERRRADPPYYVPGDSIDVYFHGPLGSLVLRLGKTVDGLQGRAAWVTEPHQQFDLEDTVVVAVRSSCDSLASSLQRIDRRSGGWRGPGAGFHRQE